MIWVSGGRGQRVEDALVQRWRVACGGKCESAQIYNFLILSEGVITSGRYLSSL